MPTEFPDVRGSWGGGTGAWKWSDTYFFESDTTRIQLCQGTIDITSQDRSSFGGRYSIRCSASITDPDGPRSSGTIVGGQVLPDGRISFRLQTEEGFEPGVPPRWFDPGCQVAADGGTYDGLLRGGTIMDVTRNQNVMCPPGRVVVTTFFYGPRN